MDINLNGLITTELTHLGADLIGFGDITELPSEVRHGLPVGISIGVSMPCETVRDISEAPTLEYWGYYHSGQKALDDISETGAEYIRSLGYSAVAMTKPNIKFVGARRTELPHKTIATRAGLGWIGKSCMLATEQYGTAVWFASILSDAPLQTAMPINESKCGSCAVCKDACPAQAISGKLWNVGLDREDFFDHDKCAVIARQRANEIIGVDYPLCGKCIAVCPRTRRYLAAPSAKKRIILYV
ncbi:iron-sulfur cluster-binding protein [Clostridia bacterium]|nr:iron-sulfur cluster-binding protein [Clostridia bacterium]